MVQDDSERGAQEEIGAAETPAPHEPGEPAEASIEALIAERDKYLELAKRSRADFENYQKRVARDQQADRLYAAQGLIVDLLPVVDNLERRWRERFAETIANARDAICVHGTTCGNGFISLSARPGPSGRRVAHNILSSRSGCEQKCVR